MESLNFNGESPKPARDSAANLASLLFALIDARDELAKARENVPLYTGQWDNDDLCADELERYNRAADNYEQFFQSLAVVTVTCEC